MVDSKIVIEIVGWKGKTINELGRVDSILWKLRVGCYMHGGKYVKKLAILCKYC
jgi:hypothetical protein